MMECSLATVAKERNKVTPVCFEYSANRTHTVDPTWVGKEAAKLALAALKTKRIKTKTAKIILTQFALQELLYYTLINALKADNVQRGKSPFKGKIGEEVASKIVTIYDDGLDPEGLQVPFDFEGAPKKKVTFFERGVAKEVSYDSFTAGREGKNSTGHGLIAPNTAGPIPINLFMKEGESSLEGMIRSVRRGIYVTRFHYTNVVEPMKAVITGMTRDGTFLIEGGEITRPIKNLRFTESILKALSRVVAISKDRKICSEGTVYSRRFITGTVVPAIKIDGFNFSGVSAL